jgi:hypothetical protein
LHGQRTTLGFFALTFPRASDLLPSAFWVPRGEPVAAKTPQDFVCLDVSPDGFICNCEPKHDGDHVAYAGTERTEVDRWPNDSTSAKPRRQRTGDSK